MSKAYVKAMEVGGAAVALEIRSRTRRMSWLPAAAQSAGWGQTCSVQGDRRRE